jgi:hypothetical protein
MVEANSDQDAQGTVQHIKQQVGGTARVVTDVAGTVVGDRMRSEITARSAQAAVETKAFAQAMREASQSFRQQGHETQASLADATAARADRLAAYLVSADLQTLMADGRKWSREVSDFARKEPMLVSAAAFTLGLFATRWLGTGTDE